MALEAGKPFPYTVPGTEQISIDMDDSGLSLLLCYDSPTIIETEEIRVGTLTMALTTMKGIIFFLAKFGSQPWFDLPYNVHLSRQLTALQKPAIGTGYLLTVVMVDIATGLVKVIRAVDLPHNYSAKVYEEILKQQSMPLLKYERTLNSVYMQYRPKDLLEYAIIKEKC